MSAAVPNAVFAMLAPYKSKKEMRSIIIDNKVVAHWRAHRDANGMWRFSHRIVSGGAALCTRSSCRPRKPSSSFTRPPGSSFGRDEALASCADTAAAWRACSSAARACAAASRPKSEKRVEAPEPLPLPLRDRSLNPCRARLSAIPRRVSARVARSYSLNRSTVGRTRVVPPERIQSRYPTLYMARIRRAVTAERKVM
jgi:hypothetical protein